MVKVTNTMLIMIMKLSLANLLPSLMISHQNRVKRNLGKSYLTVVFCLLLKNKLVLMSATNMYMCVQIDIDRLDCRSDLILELNNISDKLKAGFKNHVTQ